MEPTWSFPALLGLRAALQQARHAQEMLLAHLREAGAAGGARSPWVGPGDGCWGSCHQRGRPPSRGTACVGHWPSWAEAAHGAELLAAWRRRPRKQARPRVGGCRAARRKTAAPARAGVSWSRFPPAAPSCPRASCLESPRSPASCGPPPPWGLGALGPWAPSGGDERWGCRAVRPRSPGPSRTPGGALGRGVAAEATSPRSRCGGAGAGMERARGWSGSGAGTRRGCRLSVGTDSWLGHPPPRGHPPTTTTARPSVLAAPSPGSGSDTREM